MTVLYPEESCSIALNVYFSRLILFILFLLIFRLIFQGGKKICSSPFGSFFRYHAALRNTGLLALSTPYIDALGTGAVITAAHIIYGRESSHLHSKKDQVIGVMGADFPLSYFHKYVCREVYLITLRIVFKHVSCGKRQE